jgi:hypothetical protein
MQDVEDFNQTNEGNNEEERKQTSPCRHTTFGQNCALGNLGKGLKNNLSLVIRASKLAKQRQLPLHVISTMKLITCNFYKQIISNVGPSN